MEKVIYINPNCKNMTEQGNNLCLIACSMGYLCILPSLQSVETAVTPAAHHLHITTGCRPVYGIILGSIKDHSTRLPPPVTNYSPVRIPNQPQRRDSFWRWTPPLRTQLVEVKGKNKKKNLAKPKLHICWVLQAKMAMPKPYTPKATPYTHYAVNQTQDI